MVDRPKTAVIYPFEEASIVDRIVMKLRDCGADIRYAGDFNREAGGYLDSEVQKMLSGADKVVVFWSEVFPKSTWCADEVDFVLRREASEEKDILIPVKLRQGTPGLRLGRRIMLELFEAEKSANFATLRDIVLGNCGRRSIRANVPTAKKSAKAWTGLGALLMAAIGVWGVWRLKAPTVCCEEADIQVCPPNPSPEQQVAPPLEEPAMILVATQQPRGPKITRRVVATPPVAPPWSSLVRARVHQLGSERRVIVPSSGDM